MYTFLADFGSNFHYFLPSCPLRTPSNLYIFYHPNLPTLSVFIHFNSYLTFFRSLTSSYPSSTHFFISHYFSIILTCQLCLCSYVHSFIPNVPEIFTLPTCPIYTLFFPSLLLCDSYLPILPVF